MRPCTYAKLESLYKIYRGYISTGNMLAEGFTNRQIALLTEENYLEKICHGFYWMARSGCEKPYDHKCVEVALSNPRAVISMESACYYQGILKEEPEVLTVATERTDRSALKMNFPVERHYFSSSLFPVGIEKRFTEFGSYNIYNAERCFCDILRLGDNADSGFLLEISDYVKAKRDSGARLMKYMELFRIKGRTDVFSDRF